MKNIINFFKNIYSQKYAIIYMAKTEFKLRYAGTYIGITWAIVNPTITVLIYWLIFSKGLKVTTPGDIPYIAYFVSGLIPWLMFSEVLNTSINGVRGNLHLIKKTQYPSEVLVFVYLLTAAITQLIYMCILLIILYFNNINIDFTIISILYYVLILCLFLIGLSWFFSSLNVLFKDVSQFVPVLLNTWFWATPIVWNKNIIPDQYSWIINYNPMTYIVDGYRNAFLYQDAVNYFNDYALLNITVYVFVFIIGAIVFNKLKSEFADAI